MSPLDPSDLPSEIDDDCQRGPETAEAPSRRRNLDVWALALAIASLFVSATALAVPWASGVVSRKERVDRFTEGVAASTRLGVLDVMDEVVEGSVAGRYLGVLDRLWTAQESPSFVMGRNTVDVGSDDFVAESRCGAFSVTCRRVCYPAASLAGPRGCYDFSDFRFDPNSGLISRFSIQGIPIDMLVSQTDLESDLSLAKRGSRSENFRVFQLGAIRRPDMQQASVALLLSSDIGDTTTTRFGRGGFEAYDRNVDEALGRRSWALVWPRELPFFVQRYAAVRLPTAGEGWLTACSKRDSGKRLCAWVSLP